jgi:hypothetical protein
MPLPFNYTSNKKPLSLVYQASQRIVKINFLLTAKLRRGSVALEKGFAKSASAIYALQTGL